MKDPDPVNPPRPLPLPEEPLAQTLADIGRHPVRNLVAGWNWKSGALSAAARAPIFLSTNLRAGRGEALRAALVEALFAIAISGLMGAATQRLRRSRPLWATALCVWLVLPVFMVSVQAGVHHAAGTPHLRAGLIASFILAAFASGFGWFAQRRGLLLSGPEKAPAAHDLRELPRCVLDFFLALPRALRP